MKCPACAYENAEEASFCSLCYAVLKKELRASSPEVAHGVAGLGEAQPNAADPAPGIAPPIPLSPGPNAEAVAADARELGRANQILLQGNPAELPEALAIVERAFAKIPRGGEANPVFAALWTLKGICLNRLGRKDEALRCFDAAVEINPGYGEAWNNKGSVLDDFGRLEESLAAYERAVALNPKDANSFCDRGYVLKKLKRVEEAVASYDQALAIAPDHLLALNNKGNALLALKRWQDAVACYDRVLAIQPTHQNARASREHAQRQLGLAPAERPVSNPQALALYRKSSALQQEGRFGEALAAHEAALQLEPSSDGWGNKAAILKKLGRLEEALACYDEGLKLEPRDVNHWYNKANTFFALKRFEEAVAAYDKALEIDPAHLGAWNNKGASFGNLGRPVEAYMCFSRAVKISPQYAMAVEGMQRLKLQLGPFAPPEGFQDVDISVEPLPPPQLKHLGNKASGLIRIGLYEEALRYCDQALALDAGFGQACVGRGLSLLGLGRSAEGLEAFDRALEATPLLPDAWLQKGLAERAAGRPGKALAAFERAAALAGKGDDAPAAAARQAAGALAAGVAPEKDFLVWTSEGCSHLARGRGGQARACFEEALRLAPGRGPAARYLKECDGEPAPPPKRPAPKIAPPAPAAPVPAPPGQPETALDHNEAGTVHFGRQRFAEALECYDRALALDPRYSTAWSNKANTLFALGRTKEAGPCYERAILCAPLAAEVWYSKAFVEKSLADWPRALRSLVRFLALARPEQKDLVGKAREYQKELLDQGVEPGVKEPLVLVSEGYGLCAGGRVAEGLALFDEALRGANWAEVWHFKGMGLVSLGNDPDALRCYDQAVSIDPTHARAWYDRGVVLGRQGKQEEAVKAYTQAVRHDPNLKEAWSNMGRLLGSLGRIQESLGCMDKALRFDPRSPIIWMNKALAEDGLRRFADARRSYQEFLKCALPEHARQIAHAQKRLAEMP